MKGLKSMKALAWTLVLLTTAVAVSGTAPADGDEITFAQVAKATKIYFRDSAEFPMRMNVEMTISDQSGRVRKHKTGKVHYDFHGYNSRSGSANAHFRGPRTVMKAALGIIAPSFVLTSILFGDAEKNYSFTLAPSPDSVMARFVSIQPCEPAKWSDVGYMPEGLCGSLSLHLDKDDMALRRFSFDESGLPVPAKVDSLGSVVIQTYHAEAEFQKAFLPDDPKPFLIPKLVTVTITTDKGKLVISSAYAPDPARRK